MRAASSFACGLAALLCAGLAAPAQVRVAQWNITNWSTSSVSSRGAAFQTAIYGVAPNGQQMAPDVMILQEIIQGGTPTNYPIGPAFVTTGQANVNAFVTLLNTAAGSPGDWAAVPYVANQGDTGNALVYRTSKVSYVDVTTLGCAFASAPCGAGGATLDVGSGSTQSPRDNQRWRIHLVGYAPGTAAADLYLYGGHFKASDTSAEWPRKLPEGQRIRADAATLPPGSNFMVGADFNVQSSSRNYYQALVAAGAGQFFDPITTTGTWNNNASFANIHTQEPATQMDDRHDQILISGALRDGQGMSYLPAVPGGNILAPFRVYSTATPYDANQWNDPNHSYRCWGNDGNHYGGLINNGTTNTQVGQAIADALVTTVAGNGHLGVYLDLQVPAKLGAPSGTIDLGTVAQNSTVTYTLQVSNAADLARFSKDGSGWGIDPLSYSLAFTSGSGYTIPAGIGPFERPAGPGTPTNSHVIVLDTSTPGVHTATLTLTTDDPENPTRNLILTANVTGVAQGACCIAGVCSTTSQAGCAGTFQGVNASCTPITCPQPTGACCDSGGACTSTTQAACTNSYQGNGTSCSPTICPSPSGACCNGTTCTIGTQFACTGTFQGAATVCGASGNPTTCCPANYNGNSGVTIDDIFGFLAGWFNGLPRTDIDGDGTITVQDIFSFLSAWFAGC
jgi:hypothetical protein